MREKAMNKIKILCSMLLGEAAGKQIRETDSCQMVGRAMEKC